MYIHRAITWMCHPEFFCSPIGAKSRSHRAPAAAPSMR